MFFKFYLVLLVALFTFFGMDVRPKKGAKNLAQPWAQRLMKLVSFGLIASFLAVIFLVDKFEKFDLVMGLFLAVGALFVWLAKRELAESHTWTGQYQSQPQLKTTGVYSLTRNPLYLGVFLFEFGAMGVFLNHVHSVVPPQWAAALLCLALSCLFYAVYFNLKMAAQESRFLKDFFKDKYIEYAAEVPYLRPRLLPRRRHLRSKEV